MLELHKKEIRNVLLLNYEKMLAIGYNLVSNYTSWNNNKTIEHTYTFYQIKKNVVGPW